MGLYRNCHCKDKTRCTHPWSVSFTVKGKRFREALSQFAERPILTKAEAKDLAPQLIAAVQDGRYQGTHPVPDGMTVGQLITLWREQHIQAHDRAWTKSLESMTKAMTKAFGERALRDLTAGDLEAYRQGLRAAGTIGAASRNLHMGTLQRILSWAERWGHVTKSPYDKRLLIKERAEHCAIRIVSPEEEQGLLAAAAPPLDVAILCALDAGLRHGEVLGLQRKDLDFGEWTIVIPLQKAKSRRTRRVPVESGRLRMALTRFRFLPAESYVYGQRGKFDKAWVAARKGAGLPGVRFHDLRHTFATRLVERGVPLSQVRDLLGHRSIVTTERYDHQSAAALRAAVGRLG